MSRFVKLVLPLLVALPRRAVAQVGHRVDTDHEFGKVRPKLYALTRGWLVR